MQSWVEAKHYVEYSLAFSSDALHVIAGVLVQIAAALLLKRRMASLLPWLFVLALTLVNEFADIYSDPWSDVARQYGETTKDVLLTMALPTLLLLAARFSPQIWKQQGA